MCYDLLSTGMFFNLLGMVTFWYGCYKFGKWIAWIGYPKCVGYFKAWKESVSKV